MFGSRFVQDLKKKLTESEDKAKKLAAQVSELQKLSEEDKDSIESKYKNVNDELTKKIKELKNAESCLRKSENSAKKLTDTIDKKEKKITELENCNKRLSLMKEQVLPLVKASVSNEDKASKKVKCRFENVGKCKLKDKCKDLHPQKICQQFSKFGSCSIDSVCELRHPEKNLF